MTWQNQLNTHQTVFQKMQDMENIANEIADCICKTLKKSGKIFIAGNGGSAADAQHFAAELTGRFVCERNPLPGIALTVDTSAITAIANDYGYNEVFARQLAGLATKDDVFVAISTSGNSENILKAAQVAKNLNIKVLGLTGKTGGKLAQIADQCLIVPSDITAHIQEAHIFIIHYICSAVDRVFFNN